MILVLIGKGFLLGNWPAKKRGGALGLHLPGSSLTWFNENWDVSIGVYTFQFQAFSTAIHDYGRNTNSYIQPLPPSDQVKFMGKVRSEFPSVQSPFTALSETRPACMSKRSPKAHRTNVVGLIPSHPYKDDPPKRRNILQRIGTPNIIFFETTPPCTYRHFWYRCLKISREYYIYIYVYIYIYRCVYSVYKYKYKFKYIYIYIYIYI